MVYGVVYLALRKHRINPRWFVIVAEFLLTGWALLFVYVTQILQFGMGDGAGFNFVPLRMYSTAWLYGLTNAESLWQVGLNILITVPLGFLLPVVFSKRLRRFVPVVLLGLAVTVSTELVQLATGRSGDIDDVIANFLGVVVGFSLLVIARAILSIWPRGRGRSEAHESAPLWRLIGAVATVVVVCIPVAAVIVKDGQDPAGHVYYGQLLPTELDISTEVSDKGGARALYRNVQSESADELMDRIRSYTGINGSCSLEYDTWVCAGGQHERLFVYPYNRWSVSYDFGVESAGNSDLMPDESAAVLLAEDALRVFEIDPTTLTYTGLDPDWGDSNLHLTFAQGLQIEGSMVWGDVNVVVGDHGAVLSVSDDRTDNSLVERVQTVSPRASVHVAAEVGLDGGPGKAVVTDVQPSFWFNDQTGYLIPTWQVRGQLTSASGQTQSWAPNIDARR